MEPESGSDPDREWVTIAILARARGIRGELSAIPLTGHPERYHLLREVYLFGAGRQPVVGAPFGVESVWEYRGRWIIKFQGVDSISDAERLEGAEVRIPLRDRPQPPEGEFYLSDLTGCEVFDRVAGNVLGSVEGFDENSAGGLLRVVSGDSGREILIPFARSICVEIDVKARRIVVELPAGLKELNS